MNLKDFLEKVPLYKWENINGIVYIEPNYAIGAFFDQKEGLPALSLYCNKCEDRTTFNEIENKRFFDRFKSKDHFIINIIKQLEYECKGCSSIKQQYFIIVQLNYNGVELKLKIMKIGQYPELQILNETEIIKLLDKKDFEIYRKGFRCESSSFGIGAYAYYRQLVEDKIDYILDEIYKSGDSDIKKLAEKARLEKNTTKKIEIIKDKIPEKLKSGGQNTLGLLHDSLSIGLHNWTDEECLTKAEKIRTALVLLLKNIREEKEDEREIAKVFGDLANSDKK